MKADSEHPSALALDRHALGVAPPDVAAHVAGCAACRGRLQDAAAPSREVPAWARALGPRRRGARAWSWRARGVTLAFGVAAFACVAVVWTAGREHGGGYVGTKGAPELRLFVKRGARVELWNPAVPVVAGDLLRLEIQPGSFAHVSVFEAAPEPATYVRLYDAAIAPGRPTALPSSWRVDAQPGDETLVVVLGPDAVAPGEIARLLADDDGRHWTRRLVVTKAPDGKTGSAP
ncbi:MAG TPA: hypothetical protein VK989_18705 [Polyangia bacterium]|nr:hypothetical protein [Polyangia bacterium]